MSVNFRLISIIFCLFWQINSESVLSQQVSYINGKVLNIKTSEPIPFTTIRLKEHQIGVFANTNGEFKIILNAEFQNDSLIITCIGFKRAAVLFKDLNEKEVNVISLTPSIYSLNEVEVKASRKNLSSATIIGRAIRNIGKNYPLNPFSYIAYYRDYQKSGNDYLNLNEAIIQSMDNGFGSGSATNTYRLLDFKKNNEFPRMNISPYYDTTASNKISTIYKSIPNAKLGDQYGNELFVLLVHDAIRNFQTRSFSFIENFSEDFIPNHIFSKPVMVLNNNLPLYKISFAGNSRITGSSISVSGAIYIQPRDYSIHKLEYSCSSLTKGEDPKEIFNIKIEYGYENSVDKRMCLKYISFNNYFTIPDPNDNDYFKVMDSYWKQVGGPNAAWPHDMTVLSFFNRKIDPVSGNKIENYSMTVGKRKAKITKVKVEGDTLYLTVRDDKFKRKETDSCNISYKNLKDINGNILNKRRDLEFRQYRELFVQEYNKSLPFTDNCFMEYKPLEQNCISKYSGTFNYWMNTPENIKISK